MQIGCIIQARTTSTRLPNKVNMDIGGWPMWRHVAERMRPFNPIVAWAEDYPHIEEKDVLWRYVACARLNALDVIMRVTGDCPLIDPGACQEVLDKFLARHDDYAANDLIRTYPDGLGCEVMSRRALEWANVWAGPDEREHVTTHIRKSKRFTKSNVLCPYVGYEDLKLSVDTQEDLDLARRIDALLPAGDGKYRLETTLEAYKRVKDQDGTSGANHRSEDGGRARPDYRTH